MNRSYTPAQIPADYHHTSAGILWTAANIAATRDDDRDALTAAIRELDAPEHSASLAERAAIGYAHRAASPYDLDPTAPGHRWATWQDALTDPWQVLADAATAYSDPGDEREGLTPGRWTPAA
ncbi:hypothetical protein AAFP30_27730 [Gordonia sp. CPCC 205515]|uniref:hypothetical protein n=1 Tax=Gordonia sp. CPCC 205515 TaxID=3140791 RepID=UPI003AF387B3